MTPALKKEPVALLIERQTFLDMISKIDELFKAEAERLNKRMEEKFGPNPFLELWKRCWLDTLKGDHFPRLDENPTPHETTRTS